MDFRDYLEINFLLGLTFLRNWNLSFLTMKKRFVSFDVSDCFQTASGFESVVDVDGKVTGGHSFLFQPREKWFHRRHDFSTRKNLRMTRDRFWIRGDLALSYISPWLIWKSLFFGSCGRPTQARRSTSTVWEQRIDDLHAKNIGKCGTPTVHLMRPQGPDNFRLGLSITVQW